MNKVGNCLEFCIGNVFVKSVRYKYVHFTLRAK